jgi:hypothetical protein
LNEKKNSFKEVDFSCILEISKEASNISDFIRVKYASTTGMSIAKKLYSLVGEVVKCDIFDTTATLLAWRLGKLTPTH